MTTNTFKQTKTFSFLKKIIYCSFILMSCSFIPIKTVETPVDLDENAGFTPCKIKNTTFKAGEVLTHKVFYNWNFVWMSAGESVSKVYNRNSKEYKIGIRGKTYSSYDWFYRVRDYFETTISKETLRPSTCYRTVEEGRYRLYDKVDFAFDKQQAISVRGKSKKEATKRAFDVDNCVHDMVSMIYYFRNVNYNRIKKGTNMPISLFMDREEWKLQLRYEGKETINVRGKGKYKAIKLSTRVSAGELFDKNSSVTIWVSDDKNKVPLQVKLELSIGSVRVYLKDYKNLRYPMTAKVEK